jgi:hypothetical protein
VIAQVPPLHALEDHVVAGLQRQMQMRHQPFFRCDDVEQIAVGLDRIDRRRRNRAGRAEPSSVCQLSLQAPGRSRRSRQSTPVSTISA